MGGDDVFSGACLAEVLKSTPPAWAGTQVYPVHVINFFA